VATYALCVTTAAHPRLTVLGAGYLGVSHAACLAEFGFDVLAVDTDGARISALSAGDLPFFEPGLEPLLRRGLDSGRLRFTGSYPEAASFGDVHFVCVGTPQRAGSECADLSQLHGCIAALGPLLERPCLVVGKSTVPLGTTAALARKLVRLAPVRDAAELAWNPEFLREGRAVEDLTLARHDLAWRPVVPLADGLQRVIDWFRGRFQDSVGVVEHRA